MQLLPFVFSIILVFALLLARLGQEEALDKTLMSSLNRTQKAHLGLLAKAERAFFIKERALPKNKTENTKIPLKKVMKSCDLRLEGSSSSVSKLSLSVFQKPLDEMTKHQLKRLFHELMQNFYGASYEREIFDCLLQEVVNKKIKHIYELDFHNEKLQKNYFKLLTHSTYPLESLVTLDPLDGQAFFQFFTLKKELFEAVFPEVKEGGFYKKEQEIKKKLKTQFVPKEQIKPLILEIAPHLSLVFIDLAISFKNLEVPVLRPVASENQEVFFYFSKDKGV